MANIEVFPIADITSMAEITGFNLQEIQSADWTDNLLQAKMDEFYSGTLARVVNIGQGTRSPGDVFTETLTTNLVRQATALPNSIVDFASSLAEDAKNTAASILAPFKTFIETTPLVILGGITLAILLLTRKVR